MSVSDNNPITLKSKAKSLAFLDGFRGIAAFLVMAGHARILLWEGNEGFALHRNGYSFFEKILAHLLSVFKYGHEMVIFFFVLSGFVIHLGYSKRLKQEPSTGFDWLNYLGRRSRRIYPPLLAVLLIGFLLDSIGLAKGYAIYSHQTSNSLMNEIVPMNLSAKTLLGNLLLLQDTYTPVWGSNSPLWSLKFEWWFCMAYPVLFFLNRRHVLLSLVFVLLLWLGALFQPQVFPMLLMQQIAGALIYWWLGSCLADIYTKRIAINEKGFSIACSIIMIASILFTSMLPRKYQDASSAIGFFCLLYLTLVVSNRNIHFKLLNRINLLLGRFSYSLYLVHFPVLVLLNGIVLSSNNGQVPTSPIYALIGIAVSTAAGYLLYLLVEKPFLKKRNTA